MIPNLKALLANARRIRTLADEALEIYLARNPNSPFKTHEDIGNHADYREELSAAQRQPLAEPARAVQPARYRRISCRRASN